MDGGGCGGQCASGIGAEEGGGQQSAASQLFGDQKMLVHIVGLLKYSYKLCIIIIKYVLINFISPTDLPPNQESLGVSGKVFSSWRQSPLCSELALESFPPDRGQ